MSAPTKKPLSKRARGRLQKMRRDPFGRLALALGAYLETEGWSAIVVGSPAILAEDIPGLGGRFRFVVTFSGEGKKS